MLPYWNDLCIAAVSVCFIEKVRPLSLSLSHEGREDVASSVGCSPMRMERENWEVAITFLSVIDWRLINEY